MNRIAPSKWLSTKCIWILVHCQKKRKIHSGRTCSSSNPSRKRNQPHIFASCPCHWEIQLSLPQWSNSRRSYICCKVSRKLKGNSPPIWLEINVQKGEDCRTYIPPATLRQLLQWHMCPLRCSPKRLSSLTRTLIADIDGVIISNWRLGSVARGWG